jgi:hypothetical protein
MARRDDFAVAVDADNIGWAAFNRSLGLPERIPHND